MNCQRNERLREMQRRQSAVSRKLKDEMLPTINAANTPEAAMERYEMRNVKSEMIFHELPPWFYDLVKKTMHDPCLLYLL